MTLVAAGEQEQEGIGARLARALSDDGAVIYLRGDLGAGKTTLVRGFLRALGHRGAVKSPTYTLMESYDLAGRVVHHLDLYRLGDPEELEYLGVRDLYGPGAVLLVEWPERGAGWLPNADLMVDIGYLVDGRRIALTATSDVGAGVLGRFGAEAGGLWGP